MKKLMLVLIVMVMFLTGCGGGDGEELLGDPNGMNFKLAYTKNEGGSFKLDVSIPYKFEFGRGSGLYGFDKIIIENSTKLIVDKGNVILELDDDGKKTISKLISDLNVPDMATLYSADICDGTQWYVLAEQLGVKKKIYFDNHFPDKIQHFAVELDKIIKSELIKNSSKK